MNARRFVGAATVVAGLVGVVMVFDSASAPVVRAGRLAGIAGAGTCSLWVQNMDETQSATTVVDFYKQGGGAPISIVRPNFGALGAVEIDLSAEPTLQNGAYAAITSSDREIGVVNRCSWQNSGAAAMSNGSLPGTEMIVPLAAKNYEGQTSLITIQNSDTGAQANATVKLYALGQAQPLGSTNVVIAPGTSTTLDLAKHAAFAAVPTGTIGHIVVSSSMPVAVNNIVDVETSQYGVYSFEGIPTSVVTDTLYAPQVHAASPLDPTDPGSPKLDSMMMVVNSGTAAADVTIRYTGASGACQGQTYTHPAFTLAAGTSALVANAAGASFPLTGASPLPAGCNASAVIEATGGKVTATVVDRDGAGGKAAAYNAMSRAGASDTVGLPIFRRDYGAERSTTAVQVMNVGTAPVTVTMEIRDANGLRLMNCGADCRASIPPGRVHLWWPPSMAAISDGFTGSAALLSNAPVAAVVTDISLAGVDLASYVGIAQRADNGGMPPVPVAIQLAYSPILAGGFRAPPPSTATRLATPRPTHTPTDTLTPTPMSTPTPMPTSTVALPTSTPVPTATPIPSATPVGMAVSDAVRNQVPPAAVAEALAHPERIAGWGQPRDPGKPVSPANPLRQCLTLVDPGKPYHPLFNGLIWKAGCP